MGKSVRSLLWHALGSYLIVPLMCALFTGGASLFWYLLPFAALQFSAPYYRENLMIAVLPFIPGVALWAVRQFFRAWVTSRIRERNQIYY